MRVKTLRERGTVVHAYKGVGYSLTPIEKPKCSKKRVAVARPSKQKARYKNSIALVNLAEAEKPKAIYAPPPVRGHIPERQKVYYQHTGFIPYPSRNRLMGSK